MEAPPALTLMLERIKKAGRAKLAALKAGKP